MIKIWFVVVSYNSSETIVDALSSIIDCLDCPERIQYGFNQVGICVSDDGSKDDSFIKITEYFDLIKKISKYDFIDIIVNKNLKNEGTVKNLLIGYELIKKNIKFSEGVYIKGVAGDDRIFQRHIWKALNYCINNDIDILFASALVYKNNKLNGYMISMPNTLSKMAIGKILITRYHYIMTISNITKLDYAIKMKKAALQSKLVLLDDWIDSVVSVTDRSCKYIIMNIPLMNYFIHHNSVMRTSKPGVSEVLQADLFKMKSINMEYEKNIINTNIFLKFIYYNMYFMYEPIILFSKFLFTIWMKMINSISYLLNK